MDVLEARPRTLSGDADRADALAALDAVSDTNGDLRKVAIDGAKAVGMVDHDDETAEIAVVPRDGDPAVRGREHVRSGSAFDVEAAMATEQRIAL